MEMVMVMTMNETTWIVRHLDDRVAILDKKYGLPSLKKYPMPDAAHVRSAIKFFNYVDPEHEKELAKAILNRMKEYGMTFEDFTVGEDNRFSKYIPKDNSLSHHGILGQKWGVRRFQNPDGSLTEAGKERAFQNAYKKAEKEEKKVLKKDLKWIKKNENKIRSKAEKESKSELDEYAKLLAMKYGLNKNGKISAAYVNNFNQGMAALLNDKVQDITSPSGRAVKFIAKRGELGVYTALADQGYDMSQVKNGVWTSGRIAYKKTGVNKVDYDD